MNTLGAWILSILGIVIIGAVIDLVLPSGKMNKYIKSIFAAVTILVIVLPLPNLLKNGCDADNFIINPDIKFDENYLDYSENIKKNHVIKGLRAALQQDGITLGEVSVSGDFSGAAPVISEVKINLSQVVIVGQSEHINKYELIRSKVSQYLSLDKDAIVIYENRIKN